jgi:hypothetical protein
MASSGSLRHVHDRLNVDFHAEHVHFSFWSYEMSKRYVQSFTAASSQEPTQTQEAISVLLCGGLAGVATWVSIFPLGNYAPPIRYVYDGALTGFTKT